MAPKPISPHPLLALLSTETKHWNPQHITTLNSTTSFKTAKLLGSFPWHSHSDTDEIFLCLSGGTFTLELAPSAASPAEAEKSGAEEVVALKEGDLYKVPRGMQHRPVAEREVGVLLVEAVGTLNTGELGLGHGRAVVVDESEG